MASDALVITGPTASGKTAAAVEVALRLGGEIISMDSRQVYRGMDIGTAKPDAAERRRVPHHGFDLVEPDERYSAGRFARDARGWLEAIRGRDAVPIIAGGTGFFLRALLEPLFSEPELDGARRERLRAWLAALPAERLGAWAAALTPGGPVASDRQRQARLVEVALLTGRPLPWWHARTPAPPPVLRDPLIVVLEVDREVLYRRINERVERMLEAGLVAEVAGLLARGYEARHAGLNATGYIELIPHVRGERTLEAAKTLIQNATRAYARRQLTWLRNQLPDSALRVPAERAADVVADEIVTAWRRRRRT